MENMREYWAREAEMMRDKSAVLGNNSLNARNPNVRNSEVDVSTAVDTVFLNAFTGRKLSETKTGLKAAIVFVAVDKVDDFIKNFTKEKKTAESTQKFRDDYGLMIYMIDGLNELLVLSDKTLLKDKYVCGEDGKPMSYHPEFIVSLSISWKKSNNYIVSADASKFINGESPIACILPLGDELAAHVHPNNVFTSFLSPDKDGTITLSDGGVTQQFNRITPKSDGTRPSEVDRNNQKYRVKLNPNGYSSFMYDVIVHKDYFVFYAHWQSADQYIKISRKIFSK